MLLKISSLIKFLKKFKFFNFEKSSIEVLQLYRILMRLIYVLIIYNLLVFIHFHAFILIWVSPGHFNVHFGISK
jgi:hypothetical protein